MDQLRLRRGNTSDNLELGSQLQVTNSFWNGSTRLGQSIYGYGVASRLQTVGDGTSAAGYTYLANSPLVGQIGFTNNGTLRMTTSKQYDFLNRLLSISSAPAAAPALNFNYTHNDANQRIKVTLADASFWLYEYDSLGQVQSGKRYWLDWTPVAGQQFEYAHDDIGNRSATKAGGDENGANLRGASYSANSLNQYTNRTVPGALDIIGVANATATVTVNNQSTYRHGEYYRKELAVTNSAAAQWQSVTNKAVQSGTTNTVTGNIFVAKTPEAFTYDADGNLLTDGRWNYVWDAENRLIEMGVNTIVGAQKYLRFEYDWQGRRIGKKVWNSASGNGQADVAQKFLYDGWNLIGILNSSFALQTSFTWGLDLSGSVQGAGGVGGLVAMNDVTNGVHFVAHDSNGNVAALVKASDGTVSANYEYGPFGEVLRASGSMARTNAIRFSTKYQDDETDLVYYGYRYYNASTGRWLSRDPIEEDGGVNLYCTLGNHLVSFVDALGLKCSEATGRKTGRFLYVFTDPVGNGGGWQLTDIYFAQKSGSAQAQSAAKAAILWEANVSVLCKCESCFQERHGVRELKVDIEGPWLIYNAASLPLGPPTATGVANGLAKLAGKAAQQLFKQLTTFIVAQDVNNLVAQVVKAAPVAPQDGAWKGGKSPCDAK